MPRGYLLVLALLCLISASADAKPKIIPKLGPCSSTYTATIQAYNLSDFAKRTLIKNTSTVLIYMMNNITVNSTVVFGNQFSCTIIKADPSLAGAMPFFHYPSNDNMVVRLENVTNMIFLGIGIQQDWTYDWMPKCKPPGSPGWWSPSWWQNDGYWDNSWTCAGLYIYRSFNIQFSQGTILGRLDIVRSGAVEVSYSYIYTDSDFWQGINSTRLDMGYGWSFATVTIKLCGDQANLIRANNRIAHNYIRGSSTTVLLFWGAVGNIIQNNYITGFSFGGLQCGQGMQNVADCMLNTFELNYITPEPGIKLDSDGSGIYYDLHWVNPGNRDSCNYVYNHGRCFYIDYTTSGLLVEGAVCIFNNGTAGDNGYYGGSGIKLNTGKFNTFRSVVMVTNGRLFQLGWMSCQNWCINRCGPGTDQAEGNAWWNGFLRDYNGPIWNTNYPYMQSLCTATSYKWKGVTVPCNPGIATIPNPGSPLPQCYWNMSISNTKTGTYYSPNTTLSGNCSGLPVLNDFQSLIFVSNFTITNPGSWYYSLYQLYIDGTCNAFGTTMAKLNNVPTSIKKWLPGTLGFNDEKNNDFGADNLAAPIYQTYPNFFSCPRRLVGPQTQAFATSRHRSAMFKKYNRFRPRWMSQGIRKEYFKPSSFRDYAMKFKSAQAHI